MRSSFQSQGALAELAKLAKLLPDTATRVVGEGAGERFEESRIVELSRASYGKMVQNLWWATGYNVLAIPLAAGVLAPKGIILSPAVGAILMWLSTVIVAVNAQLLRRERL